MGSMGWKWGIVAALAGSLHCKDGQKSAKLEAPPARQPDPVTAAPAVSAAPAVAPPEPPSLDPAAFPDAEGFGAAAKGGRGGKVCKVTSLAKSGAGTLAACLNLDGPRIVVFDVSGVVEGPLTIKHGRVTLAGQTSPGGIIVKGGLVCDNVHAANDCNDVVIRHIRFRNGAPDSLRLDGVHDVIVDHSSFAQAKGENIVIARSSNVTIQWSVIAEPQGESYAKGGVLVDHSKDAMPLDGITLHHNVWNGVASQVPQIGCEESEEGRGTSNCKGHVARIEISNNLMWDVAEPIGFHRCTGAKEGNSCAPSESDFKLALNIVGNVLVRRTGAKLDDPFIEPIALRGDVFTHQNATMVGEQSASPRIRQRLSRLDFPSVGMSAPMDLQDILAQSAGAFPRDPMDERLASYLTRPVDQRPRANDGHVGLVQKDSLIPGKSRALGKDGDRDGMPDEWETAHGLDPAHDDANAPGGCGAGYTAIECYVNELAQSMVPARR